MFLATGTILKKKKKGKKENKRNGSLFTTIAILQSYSRLPAINVH